MKVEQLMSRPVVSIRANDSLTRAAHKMWTHDCGALPVVNEANHVIGMITDRDICMSAYFRGQALQDLIVANAMSREVYTTSPSERLEDAEATMSKAQVRRLPVVNGSGEVVGMLSMNDIMLEISSGRKNKTDLKHAVDAMAATCAPRDRQMMV